MPNLSTNRPARAPTSVRRPGWRTWAGLTVLYLGALVGATWPAMTTLDSELPTTVDPLVHLWTMRWNRDCLLAGRLPFFCPSIQYPVGAALGTLPPMHFQTLLYIPLASFLGDPACYNAIRITAFVLTGLGTFTLALAVLKSRASAAVAGLAAMLSTPMTYFSHGELEQITVGWFPIFLLGWVRWVDRPTGRGLAWAVGSYALVAMSAPYYGLFAAFPATLYVAWRGFGLGRSRAWAWAKARLGWFAGFGLGAGVILAALFGNQLWALAHGFPLSRPDGEFAACRAPLWGYFVPTPVQRLSRVLPFDTNVATGFGPTPAYLGVVTWALIGHAAVARVRFARRGFWWATFVLLVVLSLGASAEVAGYRISLPAAWLKAYFVGFRMIRVPARFSLFAGVVGGVLAGAGLRDLLRRPRGRATRLALAAGLMLAIVADLATVPYPTTPIPPLPPAYAAIRAADPAATFCDVPQFDGGSTELNSACTYWQGLHQGPTSAGYTAFPNREYVDRMYRNSPFAARFLAQPDYLADPASQDYEWQRGVDARGYAWLYLQAHGLRYVVVHPEGAVREFPVHLGRLHALLAPARTMAAGPIVVYDRDRLPIPDRPVAVLLDGWGGPAWRDGRRVGMVGPAARVAVFNPDADRPLVVAVDALAHRRSRAITLRDRATGRELARWRIEPDRPTATLTSPPFPLPRGITTLELVGDGDDPAPRSDRSVGPNAPPFSYWASRVDLRPAEAR